MSQPWRFTESHPCHTEQLVTSVIIIRDITVVIIITVQCIEGGRGSVGYNTCMKHPRYPNVYVNMGTTPVKEGRRDADMRKHVYSTKLYRGGLAYVDVQTHIFPAKTGVHTYRQVHTCLVAVCAGSDFIMSRDTCIQQKSMRHVQFMTFPPPSTYT